MCPNRPLERKSALRDSMLFYFLILKEYAVLRLRIATIADGSVSIIPPAKTEVVAMTKQCRIQHGVSIQLVCNY